ncbi:DUF883 family protein [Gloeobacter morelensis]|uniref:DUF883 domain-containing protein n=1 Tax=Gloeobacter morelensis MG652769 TaxID=2781736 RepID=A0ABY3PL04_9CYAN|nr:hypothetical protein [Gloeobacter morelensis]UFP94233.1 hypothetical protein ISF26_21160 [Gloeobacter morelensis MG652769]
MENKPNYGDFSSYLPHDNPSVGADDPEKHNPDAAHRQAPPATESTGTVQVKERIDEALHQTAGKLHDLAQKLESYGESGSQTGKVTEKVAGGLHRGAEYLEKANVDDLGNRVTETIRKQPLASLGIAFGVGFVIARLLRR